MPTAKSKFQNERNPIVPQAILVGDLHALLPAMVLSLSDPLTLPLFLFFFFFAVERGPQGGSTTREMERVSFFFLPGECEEGMIENVPYHSTKLSGGLTLSSWAMAQKDRGRGIRKL